jgi:uncharacterized membrane protein
MKTEPGIHSSKLRRLAVSGLVMAIYVIVMYFTQSFAFGQYQIRIATGIYALAAIHPYLIIPLGLANSLSNFLFGQFFLPDVLGGFIAGILTSAACYYLRKITKYLVALPILLIPSLVVPAFLSSVIKVPYTVLAISIGIGQILPSIVGVILFTYLEKPLNKI